MNRKKIPQSIVGCFLSCLAISVAVILSGGEEPSTVSAANASISTLGASFIPANVTINVGDTVNWSNLSGHTVTQDGSFDFSTGSTFSYQYTQAGTFAFYCFFHRGSGMVGQVTVEGISLTLTPTASPVATSTPTATPVAATATPRLVPTAIGSNRQFLSVGVRNGSFNSADVSVFPATFYPKVLTVKVGQTVRWIDQGTTHTVKSEAVQNGVPLFDSGPNGLTPGQTFAYRFDTPGTFPYYCIFHGGVGGVGHAGVIVVE